MQVGAEVGFDPDEHGLTARVRFGGRGEEGFEWAASSSGLSFPTTLPWATMRNVPHLCLSQMPAADV